MSLSGAAAALGLPESLVQRSAAARAAESGVTVDEILAAWAGGEAVEATPAPEPQPSPEETVAEETVEPAAESAPPLPIIETVTPAPVAAAVGGRAPIPSEVSIAEAAHLPDVITVPTAGIRERTNFVIPRWLIAVMLVVPLIALFALGGSSTGACGEATELDIDVISGEVVNCDGSEFTGGGAGGGATDFVALGGDLYVGAVTPAANCAGCHGANGEGGVGPGLNGVLTTFGVCEDHVEWVRLGSGGFEGTYGDTNKPVAGGMPPHAALTEEQLRSVVAFERVRFGGGTPEEVLADCGLVEPEGDEGGEGETPADGEGDGTTGTTVPAADAEAAAAVSG